MKNPLDALLACLLSACDLWPRDLVALAESINQQLGGQTTAWLVGGDIVVIIVEGSPVFERAEDGLTHHGDEVLLFLAPVASKVGLVAAENVNFWNLCHFFHQNLSPTQRRRTYPR